jgi:hypothetical protein
MVSVCLRSVKEIMLYSLINYLKFMLDILDSVQHTMYVFNYTKFWECIT